MVPGITFEVLLLMGDMAEIFNAMREHDAERRQRNLEKARKSELPWVRHTEWHWSLELLGDRLDYWPTKNKFRWRDKTYNGGVEGFIKKRQ